ncbi:16S rRNA (guanine(527)-N(7))-methyltransferase RsmG [Altererythrobacter aurantiacus]|uniref:Ribosomal RNA small subunit methyltransferase G n=1 Tax=Parapontixanthobacter aurantiacus TaxID=1463599 RepID=A0A844ZMF7_9SPHN|nr:16S rRNA (guanine(527)-N(7))-methyltransferase RsmG [Parapontixanthobacter aurantiacus]
MLASEAEAKAYVASLCEDTALERLELLAHLLKEENERQNLVSRGSLAEVWLRHIADSAQLLSFVPRGTHWVDLGSGAGFPGLVLAIMRPDDKFSLVESRTKRVEWLERATEQLTLANCKVFGQRLEMVETFAAGAITARAFAPLPRLVELAKRFSTKDTVWVLPKGRSAIEEVNGLPRKLRSVFHVEQSRTSSEAGILVGTGL